MSKKTSYENGERTEGKDERTWKKGCGCKILVPWWKVGWVEPATSIRSDEMSITAIHSEVLVCNDLPSGCTKYTRFVNHKFLKAKVEQKWLLRQAPHFPPQSHFPHFLPFYDSDFQPIDLLYRSHASLTNKDEM